MTTPVIRRRKKPIEVDTIQWTGSNEAELIAFTNHHFEAIPPEDRAENPEITAQVFDVLHSTWIGVYTGQHIVRGVKGEHHPIAEDVLAETYEAVSSAVAQSAPAETALRDRIAAEAVKQVTRAIYALKSPAPPGSKHYRSGWDDGLEAAIDAARDALLRRLANEPQPAEAGPVPEPPIVCEGFQWIGQPFTACDRCGQPAWEHAGEDVAVEGDGPFDNRRTVRPWGPGEADRIRAKWAPALSQPGKEH